MQISSSHSCVFTISGQIFELIDNSRQLNWNQAIVNLFERCLVLYLAPAPISTSAVSSVSNTVPSVITRIHPIEVLRENTVAIKRLAWHWSWLNGMDLFPYNILRWMFWRGFCPWFKVLLAVPMLISEIRCIISSSTCCSAWWHANFRQCMTHYNGVVCEEIFYCLYFSLNSLKGAILQAIGALCGRAEVADVWKRIEESQVDIYCFGRKHP